MYWKRIRFQDHLVLDNSAVALVVLAQGQHQIGARDNVELRTLPFQPVFADRISDLGPLAGVIPHLEEIILGVVPDAIVERRRDGTNAADQKQKCGSQFQHGEYLSKRFKTKMLFCIRSQDKITS